MKNLGVSRTDAIVDLIMPTKAATGLRLMCHDIMSIRILLQDINGGLLYSPDYRVCQGHSGSSLLRQQATYLVPPFL
jgi:hypothetical protein